jgi:RNA recognition motif-containing protein
VDALNSSDESEMEINNPNNTIYISNLNEKINIEELKHVLE